MNSRDSAQLHHCAVCHRQAALLSSALTLCSQWSQSATSRVYIDSKSSIQTHVTKVMQTCFFQLRHLHQIRRLLSHNVTVDVVAMRVQT